MGVDGQRYLEMLTVLAKLEVWSAALASHFLTGLDTQVALDFVHQISEAWDRRDLKRYAGLDRRFHEALSGQSANTFLKKMDPLECSGTS